MYIEKIKKDIENHIGKYAIINCNLGRNKYETYRVKIIKTFNYVFLVELEERKEVKSFSYIDVITKTVKIDYQLANQKQM